DELRMKILSSGTATPGSVFAWEVTEEEKTVFTQYHYSFQDRDPALVSRLSMTVPAGWDITASMFNHEKLDAKISGQTYTWELQDLPWIEREEYSPALTAIIPQVAVSYF